MNSPVPSAETRPIQLYREARASDQQDALHQSAPKALTDLLAAAMQAIAETENSIGPEKGQILGQRDGQA